MPILLSSLLFKAGAILFNDPTLGRKGWTSSGWRRRNDNAFVPIGFPEFIQKKPCCIIVFCVTLLIDRALSRNTPIVIMRQSFDPKGIGIAIYARLINPFECLGIRINAT